MPVCEKIQLRGEQPIYVNEPSTDDTIFVGGLKEKYELHHAVRISDEALVAASNYPAGISMIASCLIKPLM